MAESPIADAGFLVALLSRRDANHRWAVAQAERRPPPWSTCEAALSEAFHLLEARGQAGLAALLRRRDPVVVTTDTDFRIYRRHDRQAVPCVLPP